MLSLLPTVPVALGDDDWLDPMASMSELDRDRWLCLWVLSAWLPNWFAAGAVNWEIPAMDMSRSPVPPRAAFSS
jgi:hypothetical protein